jgi:hypothetical protein
MPFGPEGEHLNPQASETSARQSSAFSAPSLRVEPERRATCTVRKNRVPPAGPSTRR